MSGSPTVFIAAGEQSGDLHGAQLARELKRLDPAIRLLGIGGSEMAAAGVACIADIDDTAVVGVVEVARHFPAILEVRRRARRIIADEGTDLFVPIDNPGLNLDLARFAHRRGVPVLYFIAPQVWAWHASRVARLRRDVDRVCVVLPFEADFLSAHGVAAEFVGHPLLDRVADTADPSAPEHTERPVLGLFPGSRRQELARMLGTFLDASQRLRQQGRPALDVLIGKPPDLPDSLYGRAPAAAVRPVDEVLNRATVAIAKSGTITLQLALRRVPMVVGYRTHPLTWAIGRRLVRLDHLCLVNLIAGRTVVPECLQAELSAERLADAVAPLIDADSPTRARVVAGLAEVRGRLGEPGSAGRVARRCFELLNGST